MPTPARDQPAELDELLPLVYDELRRVAQRCFRKQPPDFTLRPTELVHEACLHLMRHSPGRWRDAEHFRAVATAKIWQVVIDHLRRRNAARRGGPGARRLPDRADAGRPRALRKRPLDSVVVEWHDRDVDLLDLAEALDALTAESRRLGQVVKLHWFGGLTYRQVAGVLGVSASTAEKDFRYALAWLNRRLQGSGKGVH